MGNKKITVVYQDCVMCGDRGEKTKQLVAEKGVRLHKVSFASEEGRELISTALYDHKIGTMPFYTDGTIFSTNLEDLVGTAKAKKKAKKSKTTAEPEAKKEGASDGAVTEA